MKQDRKDTLILPFEKGLIDPPTGLEKWLFLNAASLDADAGFKQFLMCEQGFRPEFVALEKAGFGAVPLIESTETFDGAFILTSRVRAVNEQNIQRAASQVKAGGVILVCGEKATGIAAIRKWVGSRVEITDSLSKHHAVCFWFKNDVETFAADAQEGHANGMFSASGPDKGSELLTRHFDNRIKGKVADFGAGWGYLSQALLEASERIDSLDLYEAEWLALETAKRELNQDGPVPIGFHWIDIQSEFRKKPFEWIVMNPPFHHGLHSSRAPDAQLGRTFIQTAASSLVKGGKLLMVANRNLPYEETLTSAFRKVVKLADDGGYKVIEATK